MFNGNISDAVGKRGRILGVVIFIFNMLMLRFKDLSFKDVSYVYVKMSHGEPLYETIGTIGAPGLCIFG